MAGAAGGWEVYLSGSSLGSFDEALAVAVNSAGDVVASGYRDELSGMALDVAKLSGADGTVRWQYRLPGEESKPQAVAVDPSGDVIAVGSIDGPGSRDFVVIRLAGASGQELWRTVLYGTSTDPDGHWSLGFAVALDQSGDIVSAGSTNNAQTDEDFTVVKLGSADGHEVWRTVIDGTGHGLDRAFAITTDPAGDIVAVGDTTNAAFGEDILVVKLTGTDGREVWRRVIGPSPEARVVSHASSVAINPTGDVLVAGSVSDVEVHQTFTVLKLAGADGVELWRAEMGESQAGVALDDDGDVIACGTVGEQFVVTKRSGTDGSELWTRMVGPGEGYTVSVRAGEQVFAGGRLTVPGNLATPGDPGNFVVVRLDGQTGNELWRTVIDGTFNGQPEGDWVNALAVDAAGDVVAVGRTVNVHTGVDFTVVKLPGATGEVGPSAVVTCSVDAECDDGDPCTVEHCIVGEGCISGLAQAPLECRSASFARSLHDIIFRIRSVDARQLGGRNHARKLLALVVKARQRVRRDGRRHAPPSDRALERTGRLLAKFRIGIFVARQRRAMNFSLAQSLTEHLPCLFPECCPYVSVCAPPR